MDDPQKGETVEETKGTVEQPTQPEASTDEMVAPLEDVETAEKPDIPPTEDNVPVDDAVSEDGKSAKAFQKMRQEIKSLKEALGEKQRRESVFRSLKPSVPPIPPTVEVNQQQFIDPMTGQFDQEAYSREYTLRMQEQQRAMAQQNAQQQTYEMIDEMRAKEKYPQLDPDAGDDIYDPKFERAVAAEWLLQKYQGQQPSLLKIAEEKFTTHQKTMQQKTQQAQQEEGEKEQASLSPQTRSQQGYGSSERLETLRRKTRLGDLDSVVERMKHIKS